MNNKWFLPNCKMHSASTCALNTMHQVRRTPSASEHFHSKMQRDATDRRWNCSLSIQAPHLWWMHNTWGSTCCPADKASNSKMNCLLINVRGQHPVDGSATHKEVYRYICVCVLFKLMHTVTAWWAAHYAIYAGSTSLMGARHTGQNGLSSWKTQRLQQVMWWHGRKMVLLSSDRQTLQRMSYIMEASPPPFWGTGRTAALRAAKGTWTLWHVTVREVLLLCL